MMFGMTVNKMIKNMVRSISHVMMFSQENSAIDRMKNKLATE